MQQSLKYKEVMLDRCCKKYECMYFIWHI